MYYLSFDVANKSLAVSLINYNKNYKTDITEYLNNNEIDSNTNINEYIENINKIINEAINYIYYAVEDLIPGKKIKDTTIIERSYSLRQVLTNIKNVVNDLNTDKIILLIEYQMCSNYNANAIYNQIIYEFCEDLYEIHVVRPTYKNKFCFKEELEYCNFIQKYTNTYVANKNHCKENFLFYLKTFNLNHVLENVKKKNIDDLADSFMQIFGYIKYCN